MRQRWCLLTHALLTLSLLGGNSAWADETATEEKLRERATAYWDAWRANDLHTIYYMEAGTVDGKFTPDIMRKSLFSPLRLVDYKFGELKMDGDKARIILEMTMTRPEIEGETFEAPRRLDTWTFTHGNWYHGTLMEAPETTENKTAPAAAAGQADKK